MRTLNFARFFKQYGDVDIVYSQGALPDPIEPHFFSGNYHVEKEPYPEDISGRVLLAAKGTPYPIAEYGRDSLGRLFGLIEANDYSAILARYCQSTSGLFRLAEKYRRRTIVDIDDILSGAAYGSYFNGKQGIHRKVFRALNRKLLERYERRCLNFGAALFCSELDRKKLDRNGSGNTFVVPNIYENRSFEAYAFGDGYQQTNTLLFVGTLHYPPNIEGLKWFIQTIFRKFKSKVPDAKLIVVGHAPAPEVKVLCERETGVELHADAADVREYYQRCRAVVVPLLSGGGTRIKILEAAMTKRPVLSTPLGPGAPAFRYG
ncbi:MAG: glycosyltransferase family 4 protein [Desulfobacterales bacterium]|nr:glycosyltransferase family 4 protein [Desulfobacterales bacterium]